MNSKKLPAPPAPPLTKVQAERRRRLLLWLVPLAELPKLTRKG